MSVAYRRRKLLLQGGGSFSPLDLAPALWLKADAGVVTGGARQFTAANSEYLSIADNASLSMGDIDFWLSCWVYFDTIGERVILEKGTGYNTGTSGEYSLYYSGGNITFSVGNGTNFTTVAGGALSGTTWYLLTAWHDSVANTINLRVNDGSVNSQARTGGSYDSGTALHVGASALVATYFDGRIDALAIGKSLLGGFATTPAATIAASLYNSGNGKTYADLTNAEKTAWGLGSFWDLNENGGVAVDRHGSNTLADNNTVTAAQGKMEGVAVDSDPSTAWQDQSGNGRHVVSSGSARPTFKSNIQNGLPILRLDGVEDGFLGSNPFSFGTDACTVFVVAKVTTKTNYGHFAAYGVNGPGSWNLRQHSATGKLEFVNGANNAGAGAAGAGAGNNDLEGQGFKLLEGAVTAGDTWTIWQNGVEISSTNEAFTQSASETIWIGRRQEGLCLNGDIGEVLIYPTALSTEDRQMVEGYLMDKWGLS